MTRTAGGNSEEFVSFTVMQAGNLVELSAVSPSIAAAANTSASVNLGDALTFHSSVAQWWITGQGGSGSNDLPTGVTSVQFGASDRSSDRSVKAFTMSVTENENSEPRSFNLELHVTTTTGTDSEAFIPLIVTQEGALVELRDITLSIAAAANTRASVNLAPALTFGGTVAQWWVTGQGGSGSNDLPTGVTSVQYGAATRVSNTSVKAFTMEVTANEDSGTRPFALELHVTTADGGDSEAFVSFTVTQQESQTLVELSAVSPSIPAAASSSASVNLASALTFHSSVAQWWVTGQGGSGSNDLPMGVTSVQFGAATRVSNTSVKAFTMEVTANENSGTRPFALELHVTTTDGGDSESFVSFTVTQQEESSLVELNSLSLSILADANSSVQVDLASALTFHSSVAQWWVTGEGSSGSDALPTGVTSVQYGAGSRSSNTSVKAFTMMVTQNPGSDTRELDLELHVTTSASGNSEEFVSFTVTQAGTGTIVTLSDISPSIPAAASSSASVDLSSALSFHSSVAEWWITGENSDLFPDDVTSVNIDSDNRSTDKNTKAFTMEVTKNSSVAIREFALELHVTTSVGGNSEKFVSFTVSQMSDKLVSISSGLHSVPADANSSASVDLSSHLLLSSSVAEWWITAESGSATLPTGINSAQFHTGNRSTNTSVKTFTLNVNANNQKTTVRPWDLELHVTTSASGNSEEFVSFRVSQPGSLIGLLRTNYEISHERQHITAIDLSSTLIFDNSVAQWWITSENGSVTRPAGVTALRPHNDTNSGVRANRFKPNNKTMTISVTANTTGADRMFSLELHATTVETNSSNGFVSFTVTQTTPSTSPPPVIPPISLSQSAYIIGGSVNPDLKIDLSSILTFGNAVVEWWITGANGSSSFPTGVSNVQFDSDNRSNTNVKIFTLNVTENTGADRPIALELHVARTTGGNSVASSSLTLTQKSKIIATVGLFDNGYVQISGTKSTRSTSSSPRNDTFTFKAGHTATHWWIELLDTSGDLTIISPVSNSRSEIPTGSWDITHARTRNSTGADRDFKALFHVSNGANGVSLDAAPLIIRQNRTN